MTITVFDCDHQPMGSQPEHNKPTFTDVATKIGLLHVWILQMRYNLEALDKALDDMHDCILELEEVSSTRCHGRTLGK